MFFAVQVAHTEVLINLIFCSIFQRVNKTKTEVLLMTKSRNRVHEYNCIMATSLTLLIRVFG